MSRPPTPSLPSRDELITLFSYDADTGLLTRLQKRANQIPGTVVVSRSHYGQIRLTVNYRYLLAHRVIWMIVHGHWPIEIDHINGNPSDNRLANLREVDHRTNSENKRRARSDNELGVQGVSRRGARFVAHIQTGKKKHHLGIFDTSELAHAAYVEAKRELHKGNTL